MKALAWMGTNTVQMLDCPKPKLLEDRDVILKVTGSTVCGSDLHLLHDPLSSCKRAMCSSTSSAASWTRWALASRAPTRATASSLCALSLK